MTGPGMPLGRLRLIRAAIALALVLSGCASSGPAAIREPARALTLPDLSGLAWIEDDLFLGVHDAKRNEEKAGWPRISLVRLPRSELEGVTWQSLDVQFPGPDGPSSDLESATRIPGSDAFLLAESGQEGESASRLFLARYARGRLTLEAHPWPVPVTNVEAIAVCRVGQHLVFIYAERADSLPATRLGWATLTQSPLSFGAFREITYQGIDPIGPGARPVVAMDVDSEGFLYIVSAYDSGNDDGPFRSVVWRIGKVTADGGGNPRVELGEAERLASLDGLKVESIAVIEPDEGGRRIYIGTDDEHYGGILRLLPAAAP